MNKTSNFNELIIPGSLPLSDKVQETPFQKGHKLGDDLYTITSDGPIHSSSTSTVYIAEDDDVVNPEVVLKIFNEPSRDVSKRVTRELSALATLNGLSGVVETRKMGILRETEQPQRFVATTFAGSSLESLIPDDNNQRLDILVNMASIILPALVEVHRREIIHNDIKTTNIVGQLGKWVLTDFGLVGAKPGMINQLSNNLEQEPWTTETISTLAGTIGYIAPELLNNPNNLTPRADVFSFGVTMFRVASGKLPFYIGCSGEPPDSRMRSYLYSVIRESPVNIHTLNRAVPISLNNLIMECLDRDPNNRPSTEELNTSIQAI
jgi:serine/threonine protein kinase